MEKKMIELEINDYSKLTKEELLEKTEEIMKSFMIKMMKMQQKTGELHEEWRECGELFINISECMKATIEIKK